MKVRLRFSKTGALVYIGHLDVMRYFQKLMRRAGIPVAYSEGFSPHQILSFTPPLPLGMESSGEYADIELTESISSETALKKLRAQSVDEIVISSFKALPDRCTNAMASVNAASYSVFADEKSYDVLKRAVPVLLQKDSVNVIKKTKKSEKGIDIRPLIYELSADDNDHCVNMLISSGSSDNIKPELVIGALADAAGIDQDIPAFDIKRIDQFTFIDENIVSLDDIGSVIQ